MLTVPTQENDILLVSTRRLDFENEEFCKSSDGMDCVHAPETLFHLKLFRIL